MPLVNNFLHVSSVLSVSLTVQEFDRRENSFKVYCTSYGGRPLLMSLTGPSGIEDIMTIVGLGEVKGIVNDTFSAKSLHHGGTNGDIYNCTASNIVSMSLYETRLKGMLHLDVMQYIILYYN